MGGANILESGALSVAAELAAKWRKDGIDYTELARRRWIEKLSLIELMSEFALSRSCIVGKLRDVRRDPALIPDARVRAAVCRSHGPRR